MKMKEYIILFYLQVTYKNEKAQGIVEYALILAFIVGVAVALLTAMGWPMPKVKHSSMYQKRLTMPWMTRRKLSKNVCRIVWRTD